MECLYRWKLTKELPVLTRNRLNELNAGDWGYNIEKAKQLLHFNPSFDLEKGMEETIKWYKENGWI
jgi:dTDP-D-glucose 4,6-dehydratase